MRPEALAGARGVHRRRDPHPGGRAPAAGAHSLRRREPPVVRRVTVAGGIVWDAGAP